MPSELWGALREFIRFALTPRDDKKTPSCGMSADVDPLAFMVGLDLTYLAGEKAAEQITSPGVLVPNEDQTAFVSECCIQSPRLG